MYGVKENTPKNINIYTFYVNHNLKMYNLILLEREDFLHLNLSSVLSSDQKPACLPCMKIPSSIRNNFETIANTYVHFKACLNFLTINDVHNIPNDR